MIRNSIVEAVTIVTKAWTKQRRAEERDARRELRRHAALTRSRRVTAREVAWEVMEAAYVKASSDKTLPAHARQIMYAARGSVQSATGEPLNDTYFTQTLLPDYLRANSKTTSDWDVVFDARGHLHEPHTNIIVPLGTLDVREYLVETLQRTESELIEIIFSKLFPTYGPEHRYQAILFIEKEGFLPLFRATRLAERFDVAIMSTKGLSVTASRLLVDELCGQFDIPLLVLHDFDKAGFSIVGTLQRDTRRYEFKNQIEVIDLGLRLKDVEKHNLEAEDVLYRNSKGRSSDPRENLRLNGATDEELSFLVSSGDTYDGYRGRRVELNAFTSGDLVAWIESKLTEQGIQKLLPNFKVLGDAYRRQAWACKFFCVS